MERETLGYLLLAALIVAAVGFVLLKLYHSHERVDRRRIRRETERYNRRLAEGRDS